MWSKLEAYLRKEKASGDLLRAVGDGLKTLSRAKLRRLGRTCGVCHTVRKLNQTAVSMHGWRHFFNTTLVMANVSDKKIREVTGHSCDGMTRRYTHLDTREFIDVLNVQQGLLAN
jgi:integrase